MGAHTYDYEQRIVDGVDVSIAITRFTNDHRASFDVYAVLDGEEVLLTEDESLDDPPSDDEVRDLIAAWKEGPVIP